MTYDLSQFRKAAGYYFGNKRADGNIRNKTDLDKIATPRYIYGDAKNQGGGTDGLYNNYYARHTDTPEGDPNSVHVFGPNSVNLKAIAARGVGDGQIDAGMMRFWRPIVQDRTYIRVRAKLPAGRWSWPAIWLNPGWEVPTPRNQPAGERFGLVWPPEADIHDGFGYDGMKPGTVLRPGEPTNNDDGHFGRSTLWEDPAWASNPGWDYRRPGEPDGWLATGFHDFGFDWTNGVLTYLLDDAPYRQSLLTWASNQDVCAHLLISNQPVPKFNSTQGIEDQGGVPGGWDFEIADVEIYYRMSGVAPNPGKLSPARGLVASGVVPNLPPWMPQLPKLGAAGSAQPPVVTPPPPPPKPGVGHFDTLILMMSEDAYQGDAMFEVKMDGAVLGGGVVSASHAKLAMQQVAFFGTWGPGLHTLSVRFTNDAFGGAGKDRNLFLHSAIVNGTPLPVSYEFLSPDTATFRLLIQPTLVDAALLASLKGA